MADPTGYGRVIRDARGRVAAIVEQKAATPEQLAIREANMGIYCFRADLFWKHVDQLAHRQSGAANTTSPIWSRSSTARAIAVEAMRIDDAREALGINNRAGTGRGGPPAARPQACASSCWPA